MSEVWSLPGYEVQALLGSGATGEVWRGRELATGDTVALKRLGEDTDPDLLEALRRTASLLRDLDTPYVVRLREVVGRVLVMDHAPGGSLASLLARRGRLSAGEVVTVAAPLASALSSAHALGVVHGEVRPASVLFTADGMPLLADLGVACVAGRLAITDRTTDYADPALGAGRAPDPAADVWALAAVCHHLLAGTPPQDAAASRQRSLRSSALELLAPTAPRALVAAVDAVLLAEPARRPDAADFAALLRRAHGAAPVRLTGGPGPGDPAGATPAAEVSPLESRSEPESGRRGHRGRARTYQPVCRRIAPVVGLVGLVVSATVVGWLLGRGDVPVAGSLTPLQMPAASTAPAPPAPATTEPVPPAPPDWSAVLDRIDAARAAAFASPDGRALSAVWAPDSAGLAADTAAVLELAGEGESAHGLRHVVQSIEVLAFDEQATGSGVARLEVVDVLAEHEIRDAAGRVVRREAGRGARVWLVELAQTPAGWRLVSVGDT